MTFAAVEYVVTGVVDVDVAAHPANEYPARVKVVVADKVVAVAPVTYESAVCVPDPPFLL